MNVTAVGDDVPVSSEQPQEVLYAVMAILAIFSLVGTVGNLLVLYVYGRKRNKLASTVFIITLAFTDFITCSVIIPYTIVLEYLQAKIQYDVLCKLYMFLITSNVPFSAFIMMAIAVDRYLCICHPFTHLLNTRRAKMIISVLASIAFVLGTITALNFGVYYKTSDFIISETTTAAETVRHYEAPQENNDLLAFVSKNNSSLQEHLFATNNTEDSIMHEKIVSAVLVHDGHCKPNGLVFSHDFTEIYQKIYSSLFVIEIVVVVILYILIYRFVSLRRARRRRLRNQASCQSSPVIQHYNTKALLNNGSIKTELDSGSVNEKRTPTKKRDLVRQNTIREKGLVANIRTAGMLFVVTAVFVVVFLPAWLMAHQVVPYNMLVFYMYFFYNVANPIIYAFMNKAFRRDLKDVIECRNT